MPQTIACSRKAPPGRPHRKAFEKVTNFERERQKLNEQIAATSDEVKKSKLTKNLRRVERLERCYKTWSDRVAVPEIYLERGTAIVNTEERAITIQQVNQLSDFVNKVLTEAKIERLTPDSVSMYTG